MPLADDGYEPDVVPYCTVEPAVMFAVSQPIVIASGVAPYAIQICSGPAAATLNCFTHAGSTASAAGTGRGEGARERGQRPRDVKRGREERRFMRVFRSEYLYARHASSLQSRETSR